MDKWIETLDEVIKKWKQVKISYDVFDKDIQISPHFLSASRKEKKVGSLSIVNGVQNVNRITSSDGYIVDALAGDSLRGYGEILFG